MKILDNKIVFLTGGNGKLGTVLCKRFVELGAKVACVDLTIQNKDEKYIKYYKCDVTDKKEISSALARIEKDFGTPNVLVNNAAIDSPPSSDSLANLPFENVPSEVFKETLNVNCLGVVYCCQEVGTRMKSIGGGSIINIGSIYGVLSPNQTIYEYKRTNGKKWYKPAAYSLSKSANINLTRYLATYWAKDNIRVNIISPAGIFNNQDKMFLEEYLEKVPMGRMARYNEIADVIAFLGSDMSSYITGQNIIVDGGLSSW